MDKVVVFLLALAMICLFGLVLALPTMWLWNWLMPIIFGLVKITFWQALGLNILCGIFFKNSSTSKTTQS